MAKVYVVQAPARRSGPNGDWVEKYDLSAAERFGELVRVLPYGNVPTSSESTSGALWQALRGFDFSSDYVLLLGDPVAIARAIHVLCQKQAIREETGDFATIRALKWDRRLEAYAPYEIG